MVEENTNIEQNENTLEAVAPTTPLTEQEKPKKKTGKKILILLLVLLGMAVVAVASIGIFKYLTDKNKTEEVEILTPDRAPEDEENGESMGDEGDKKLDQPEGGGAVSLTYTKDVVIDLSENKVSLLFGNPSRSNQGMVLQIIIQDKVIVQSGTLKPGVQVKELELTGNAKLQPGVYEGKFNVLTVLKNGQLDYVDLEDVVGDNKVIGAVQGGTAESNVRIVTMDHDLVKTARNIGICLGD